MAPQENARPQAGRDEEVDMTDGCAPEEGVGEPTASTPRGDGKAQRCSAVPDRSAPARGDMTPGR
eukprot:9648118-Lingulodinium_polyedra.AAC.1